MLSHQYWFAMFQYLYGSFESAGIIVHHLNCLSHLFHRIAQTSIYPILRYQYTDPPLNRL